MYEVEDRIQMNAILNLTQHNASREQIEAGVENVPASISEEVKKLLTFNSLPSKSDIDARAKELANIALQCGARKAMIGGAPYLMSALEEALKENGIKPLYAYSERVSVEVELEDGSVVKRNVFKHLGFVEV